MITQSVPLAGRFFVVGLVKIFHHRCKRLDPRFITNGSASEEIGLAQRLAKNVSVSEVICYNGACKYVLLD